MKQRALLLAGILACLLSSLALPGHSQSQQMGIPSYFYPGPLWTKLEAAAPTVGLAIINPNSGPGDRLDPAYAAQVQSLKQHRILTLGYVHTSYTKRSLNDVRAEMARYFQWYKVDGIFVDEVSNTKAEVAYYLQCHSLARSLYSKAVVVLNPGTQTDEGYMAACDILVNFESGWNAYQKQYAAPTWIKRYPASRFWHIVLQVPTDTDMRAVVRESKQRHAGWVFVTPYGDPNPYDKLPEQPYWSEELSALKSE